MAKIPDGWVMQKDGSFSPPSKVAIEPAAESSSELEMPLHRQIMDYCNNQWPRWKYIRARSDKRSTIALGAQDFTVFLPHGRTLCVECKSRTGKLDEDQIAWKKEMEMLGHEVHLVRSLEEFLNLATEALKAESPAPPTKPA